MRLKIIYQINERYIMKKIEMNFYRNKNVRYINVKELHRSYVALEQRLGALEKNSQK